MDSRLIRVTNRQSIKEELFIWLEEYVRRLNEGEFDVGGIGSNQDGPKGIILFPRYVPGASAKLVNGIPVVSRKITRGVEVIASAIWDPRLVSDMGFIYAIRIRLLTPEDGDEYVSPEDRGFSTCRLLQRHWRIVNDETGRTEVVDGDGVIGMTPILREGGYREQGEDFNGTFQYQSCTGPMERGSFGGHLAFEARPENGAASLFDVELGSFALDCQPDFLY
ncbi:MAG: hypothetical protein SGARI_004917 [Bacillariaceae sp.]